MVASLKVIAKKSREIQRCEAEAIIYSLVCFKFSSLKFHKVNVSSWSGCTYDSPEARFRRASHFQSPFYPQARNRPSPLANTGRRLRFYRTNCLEHLILADWVFYKFILRLSCSPVSAEPHFGMMCSQHALISQPRVAHPTNQLDSNSHVSHMFLNAPLPLCPA